MRTMSKTFKKTVAGADGFTLVEILIAITISSLLILGLNAAIKQTNSAWSKIKGQNRINQKNRLLIDTLREELGCAYFPKIKESEVIAPFSISTNQQTTSICFFTLNPARNSSAQCGYPARVCYKLQSDGDSSKKQLIRTEQLYSGQVPIGAENEKVIFEQISEFKVFAAEPDDLSNTLSWKDNIESTKSPPPAIKIEVKYNQQTNPFQACIQILSDNPINDN